MTVTTIMSSMSALITTKSLPLIHPTPALSCPSKSTCQRSALMIESSGFVKNAVVQLYASTNDSSDSVRNVEAQPTVNTVESKIRASSVAVPLFANTTA